jgi:hypothetical protein
MSSERQELVRRGAIAGGALAAGVAVYSAVRVARFVVGRALAAWGVAMFALRVVTLRAYRRCPDCRSRVDRRANVCRHCGYRRAG